MSAPLLEIKSVGKRFGGFVALEAINLDVARGERLGLIGPNGSGKSTLVNCICGTLNNETGTVHFEGRALDGLPANRRTHLGLARSFQLPRPFTSLSVADNLRIPLIYAVRRRKSSNGGRSSCWRWLGLRPRRVAARAICLRSKCASSSWCARWPPNPSC
jgi:branched-chain amino acid transport system ATP-binding protein